METRVHRIHIKTSCNCIKKTLTNMHLLNNTGLTSHVWLSDSSIIRSTEHILTPPWGIWWRCSKDQWIPLDALSWAKSHEFYRLKKKMTHRQKTYLLKVSTKFLISALAWRNFWLIWFNNDWKKTWDTLSLWIQNIWACLLLTHEVSNIQERCKNKTKKKTIPWDLLLSRQLLY